MEQEAIFLNGLNLIFEPPNKRVFEVFKETGSLEKTYRFLAKSEEIDLIQEYNKLKNLKIRLITFNDPEYPEILKEIENPPLGLYVLGNLPKGFSLAIVGTRKASQYGKEIAKKFSSSLAEKGIEIISGLAYGIDQSAHQGALSVQGKTFGILGTGIDLFQTQQPQLVKEFIKSQGGIISEYPLKTPGLAHHFPFRNRIIAGLSKGIIIIEAPEKSGALITARFGAEFGRDIFVVPGSIFSKNFKGSHQLIREGAVLVSDPSEVLEEFGLTEKISKTKLASKEEKEILELLEKEPMSLEELINLTKQEPQKLLFVLTNLEIRGIIKNIEGKFSLK